eukprot:jgi/Orpsp1_1/1187014/evm.model.d7180000054857.1
MKFLKVLGLFTSLSLASSKAIKNDIDSEEHNLPKFSLESGFYNKNSIKLGIENSDPNAIIYYTLDGTIPTVNSTVYKKPITLNNKSLEDNVWSNLTIFSPGDEFTPSFKIKKANIIRAMAKLSDGTLTNVVSGTYFVGLNKKSLYKDFPVVSIITDPDNLFDKVNGIYTTGERFEKWVENNPQYNPALPYTAFGADANYEMRGKEGERPATIEYFPSKSNYKGFSQDLGIRIMGKASRSHLQKSFRFTNREMYGKKNLKYDLIPGNMRSDGKGPVTKYKSFNIRNGGNDASFTKIRDALNQDLISNRGFETQQSDMVVVFIDGEYWGVYTIMEDYSDNYIANNYDIDDKNVILIKPDKVEAGDDNDMDLLNKDLDYIYSNDLSDPEKYENALKKFDFEEFVWYAAFNLYICGSDGMFKGANYAVWRVRESDNAVAKADGVWRVMSFDTEFSTGIYRDIAVAASDKDLLKEVLDENSENADKIGTKLITSALANKKFKNLFINALCDVRNIDF